MNKIVTISREFGSGGREVAKRLSDVLGVAYYDKEIIDHIAEKTNFAPEYVATVSEVPTMSSYPVTFGRTFASNVLSPSEAVQIAQRECIKELAEKEDCIIVGRCANSILADKAFKVFVYASDMDCRIDRCYNKVPADKEIPRKKMEKEILAVDKRRAKYQLAYADQKWGEMSNYDLCIDTSKFGVKKAVEIIAHAMKVYYE